ncbi:UNVERIFIED_ORG: DUF3800 domain-containing protein [Roseateles sp. XES5]|nr:DUF3800 domain-containing protein [Roseateles sp. XES5]
MADLPPTYSIFLDESGQTNHRFLLLGCLVVQTNFVPSFEKTIEYAKKLELPAGELKWSKVSPAKLFAYKLVADCFFDAPSLIKPLQFHTLAADMTKRKDHLFNSGSKETGFNKEIYQLLMKCARLYPDALFHVYLDHRDTASSTEELRQILNAGRRKAGDMRNSPFRRVHFRDSKSELCLQMVDILLGATSHRINGHHLREGSSVTKNGFAQYILDRAGISDAMKDTAKAGAFTIWHRRLR